MDNQTIKIKNLSVIIIKIYLKLKINKKAGATFGGYFNILKSIIY